MCPVLHLGLCSHSAQSIIFQWYCLFCWLPGCPASSAIPSSFLRTLGQSLTSQIRMVEGWSKGKWHLLSPSYLLGWAGSLTCLDLFRPYSQPACGGGIACSTLKMEKWRVWEKWHAKVTVRSSSAVCSFLLLFSSCWGSCLSTRCLLVPQETSRAQRRRWGYDSWVTIRYWVLSAASLR